MDRLLRLTQTMHECQEICDECIEDEVGSIPDHMRFTMCARVWREHGDVIEREPADEIERLAVVGPQSVEQNNDLGAVRIIEVESRGRGVFIVCVHGAPRTERIG